MCVFKLPDVAHLILHHRHGLSRGLITGKIAHTIKFIVVLLKYFISET